MDKRERLLIDVSLLLKQIIDNPREINDIPEDVVIRIQENITKVYLDIGLYIPV